MQRPTAVQQRAATRVDLTSSLGGRRSGALDALLAEVPVLGTDVRATLDWSSRVGDLVPGPGLGRTLELWETLASTAALDVGVARVLEPHLDAVSILDQAPAGTDLSGLDLDGPHTWGVFAAEGPGARLEARADRGGWVLDGVKPWCSLAADLSHALVTAWTPEGRRLFAVALRSDGVEPAAGPWVSRGLQQVVSAPVTFTAVRAVPVGDDGWYLTRPASPGAGSASRPPGGAGPSASPATSTTRSATVSRTSWPWPTSARSTPTWQPRVRACSTPRPSSTPTVPSPLPRSSPVGCVARSPGRSRRCSPGPRTLAVLAP